MSKKKTNAPIANKQTAKIASKTPPQYQTEKTPSFWQTERLPLVLFTILSLVLYLQTVRFDYALDDLMVVTKNQFTQRGFGGIGDIFQYESFRGYFGEQKLLLEGDRYRPFSLATFAAEISLFGKDPKGMSHFINVLLYVLTAFLLYRVLKMFFLQNTEGGILDNLSNQSLISNHQSLFSNLQSQLLTVPFLATALFVAHPLHTEVVANIKGRDEILALLGELGALYFTLKYLNEKQTKHLIGSFISFLIAIFSKESALTFLAVVPLTAHFFTKATNSEKLKVTLPILIGSTTYMLARLSAIGYLLGSNQVPDLMNNPFLGMSVSDKFATIFYTLLLYLKLHIFPHPLTHDYYPYHIPKMTWVDWQVLLSLVLHIGLGVLILRGWQKRSVWAYSAAFYLLTLSIASNLFVSVGTFMNERFVYHASIGFCIAAAYLFSQKLPRSVGLGLAALLLVVFSAKTLLRVPDWRDNNALNLSAIQISPNSARSNCFFAISIWENQFLKLPKTATNAEKLALLDKMRPYFERSISINPKYSSAMTMWAGVSSEYHKIDGDWDKLLANIDLINKAGVYEPFVFKYLDYANGRAMSRATGEKLKIFYTNWLAQVQRDSPKTILPQEVQKLLTQIEMRLPMLL